MTAALHARLMAEVDARTVGWPPDRKRALLDELRDELRRRVDTPLRFPSVYDLAVLMDYRQRNPPHLRLIDEALADVAAGRCNRLLILAPPQEGKSTRVVRYGVQWLLTQHPDWRFGIASYEQRIASRWGRFIRRDVQRKGHRIGLRLALDATAAAEWELSTGGGVVCTGLPLGALTGRPLDALVIDDPIKGTKQADSELHRQDVWEWYTDTALSRLAHDDSPVVLVQTRWHEDDLAGRLLEQEADAWRIIYIPAQAEAPAEDDPPWLVDALGRDPGEFLPSAREKRGAEFYEHRRARVGERTWSALYQGRPTPRAGGVFQWEWIRANRVHRSRCPELIRKVVAVDPSAEGKDEAGIVAAGVAANRHVYVTADYSGQMTVAEWTRRAWLAVLDEEADVLVYEANLVPSMMLRAIRAAWSRMRQEAEMLAGLPDPAPEVLEGVARALAGSDDDTSDVSARVRMLGELLPYVQRIVDAPRAGPARMAPVRATRGKITRAEPVAQAEQNGLVHHVGIFPALEQQQTTWRPSSKDSPDRMDAKVWAWYFLGGAGEPTQVSSPAAAAPSSVPTGASVARPGGYRAGAIPTGASTYRTGYR